MAHTKDHPQSKELEAISAIIDAMTTICEKVLQDLNRGKAQSRRTGANSMSADQVPRCAVVKVLFNFTYEELAFHIVDSQSLRWFCRIGIPQEGFQKSALNSNIKRISDTAWERSTVICWAMPRTRALKKAERSALIAPAWKATTYRVDPFVGRRARPDPVDHWRKGRLWQGARLLQPLPRELTTKIGPEWIRFYHDNRLIAQHGRCYDWHQDIEDPDHPKQLLLWRKKAPGAKDRDALFVPDVKGCRVLPEARTAPMNPYHHVQKIVALSEIYGIEAVARVMEDAFVFEAFSCEYIANLLEQRTRRLPEPGALHLTRRQDLLELEVESADLSLYQENSP